MTDAVYLKYAGLSLLLVGVLLLIRSALQSPDTALWRFVAERAEQLNTRLRNLFFRPRGRLIVLCQLSACGVLLVASLLSRAPELLLTLPLLALTPTALLEFKLRNRRKALESQLDSFTLALANALRATPSIGRALATVSENVAPPMKEELQRALQAMRVGSSLDDAVAELGARLQSSSFDAVMSALLIGRRVGGNLPQILDDTGISLREMVRLHSTLRAKTADGRVQGMVMASFPLIIVFLFDLLMPGYFEPLTQTATGLTVLAFALVSWLLAVILARQILSVQL